MVSFALHHRLRFSFRNCAFRNADLVSWTPVPFTNLFDEDAFISMPGYQNYADIILPKTGVWNAEGASVTKLLGGGFELPEIIKSHNYVVLKHYWPIFDRIINRIPISLIPSPGVLNRYDVIKENFPESYNFLHYRYESDFTDHFRKHKPQSKFPLLKNVLANNMFKRQDLPIYVGSSRVAELASPHLDMHISQMPNLFYTDELLLRDMNYEAAAYVDYLVGLNAVEVLGHSLSSFSVALNQHKGTRNFYDTVR